MARTLAIREPSKVIINFKTCLSRLGGGLEVTQASMGQRAGLEQQRDALLKPRCSLNQAVKVKVAQSCPSLLRPHGLYSP